MGWLPLSTATLGICHVALLGGILAWVIYMAYEAPAVQNDVKTRVNTVTCWTASGILFIIGLFFFFPILLLRFVAANVGAIAVGTPQNASGLNTLAVLFAFFLIAIGLFSWSMSWYTHDVADANVQSSNYGAFVLSCFTGSLFAAITVVMLYNFHVGLKADITQLTAYECSDLPGALKFMDPFWKG